jgi:hypothetical protein
MLEADDHPVLRGLDQAGIEEVDCVHASRTLPAEAARNQYLVWIQEVE